MSAATVGTFEGNVVTFAGVRARGGGRACAFFKGMVARTARACKFGGVVLVGARLVYMRVEFLTIITLNRRGDIFGDGSKGTRDSQALVNEGVSNLNVVYS